MGLALCDANCLTLSRSSLEAIEADGGHWCPASFLTVQAHWRLATAEFFIPAK
jgi:hypothetical protein